MEKSSPLPTPLSVASHTPLAPGQLRVRTDPSELRWNLNQRESPSQFSYHQPRAEKALALGIQMKNAGHIFLCGPPGTARRAIIEAALKQNGRPLAVLQDYLSVCPATREPPRPLWISLPAGRGRTFLDCVDHSIRACQNRVRGLALHRARDRERPMDEAERETWIEETDEWREARMAQIRQAGFHLKALDYLEALHGELAERLKQAVDLAAVLGLDRVLDEAESLSRYRPQMIREATRVQFPLVF